MLRFNDTLDARLAPNGKIDFKQFKNKKFAYSVKLCHMMSIGLYFFSMSLCVFL